ncbi:MAG: conjugal transfer protein TraM [Methylococcaceae bacterium]
MNDPIDELIKEIAVKHNIAVSRNDPLMILHTINERLMKDSLTAQQHQLNQYKEEMESLMLRWSDDVKGKSERILNSSLAASKDAMWQIMQEGAKTTAATVLTEVGSALAVANAPIRDAHRLATLNIVAACITFCAAAIVLWVTIR